MEIIKNEYYEVFHVIHFKCLRLFRLTQDDEDEMKWKRDNWLKYQFLIEFFSYSA